MVVKAVMVCYGTDSVLVAAVVVVMSGDGGSDWTMGEVEVVVMSGAVTVVRDGTSKGGLVRGDDGRNEGNDGRMVEVSVVVMVVVKVMLVAMAMVAGMIMIMIAILIVRWRWC